MKWSTVLPVVLALFASVRAMADVSVDLQQRLNKVRSFYASFTQKVTDSSGSNLQEGEGELWVKRPNLFNWHLMTPDESVIISDGKNLWFYNPFVEQVSVSLLQSTTNSTPFLLVMHNEQSEWQQYNIKQHGDSFELTPKNSDGNMKRFTISVTSAGIINHFSATEHNGQYTDYHLKNQKNIIISSDKFTFTPPKNVTIDDQRQ
ncbi:outer membrane lipoprotein chaperone LolA [Pantoea sp. Nvir]|uniref:outer membrane lipoprotein chaperone LolA n=1 Tax=Pantoea sp. Nvir TaxID=2576760 RepID=UPI0027F54819|nr:outer membrane lipoprotein chaperone LolA [Pantoea sp. Nvir]CAJ0992856.1 Outer-membrane lipoprotein carrier protein [Pantoea sp. Nvir]